MIGDTVVTKSYAPPSLYNVPKFYDTIKDVKTKW